MIGRFLQKTLVHDYLDIPCLNFGKFVRKISIAKIFGTFILTVFYGDNVCVSDSSKLGEDVEQ